MILNVGSQVRDDKENTYVLDNIIGNGAFGAVFKAHRESDNLVFAVKIMLPSFSNSPEENSFKNEINAATKVVGENIICYEFVHTGDTFPELPPYIIMEYADGGTLKSLLTHQRNLNKLFDSEQLLDIFKQLANGMDTINRTLVHRDIKPDNILLSENRFKISDFGLAKIVAECTRTKTFKGWGTVPYMAPEAWDFSKNTVQMDIYSMGIIFYELATLHYPYVLIPRSNDDYKNAHLYSAIQNIDKFNPSLSSSLISVIIRMLEKSVKNRFSDWQEIIQLLENQAAPKSQIDEIVNLVIATKNAQDIAQQSQESARQQKEKETADFCKLVCSQLLNTIISPIIKLADKLNTQYAGSEKLIYPQTNDPYDGDNFFWKMTIPPNNSLTIHMEVILKENHTRPVPADIFGNSNKRQEHYIPQYNNKNILAWCKVINATDRGFNLLLVESGELYGDWIIMDNKNNLSLGTNYTKIEPFAFGLSELPEEINYFNAIHLYRSELSSFTETKFLELIAMLLFLK